MELIIRIGRLDGAELSRSFARSPARPPTNSHGTATVREKGPRTWRDATARPFALRDVITNASSTHPLHRHHHRRRRRFGGGIQNCTDPTERAALQRRGERDRKRGRWLVFKTHQCQDFSTLRALEQDGRARFSRLQISKVFFFFDERRLFGSWHAISSSFNCLQVLVHSTNKFTKNRITFYLKKKRKKKCWIFLQKEEGRTEGRSWEKTQNKNNAAMLSRNLELYNSSSAATAELNKQSTSNERSSG